MSGIHPTAAEHHLGDRLAALVDGELGHDARERVLAHLATCPRCKAEADAQRRLKNVFAEAAPPPPSESFLARLQGLPGGDDTGPDPYGGGGLGSGGVFSVTAPPPPNPLKPRSREPFSLDPAGAQDPVLPGAGHGFRIHEVGRQEGERSASRGRRFAFAAAGAVSLAAIALGGVSAGAPTAAGGGKQSGPPSNATPLRTSGPVTAADTGRRRGANQPVARSSERPVVGDPAPAIPIAATAPLLPGMPAPPRSPESGPALSAPAPLIRALPTAAYTAEPGSSSGSAFAPPGGLLDTAPKSGASVRTVR
ncbi:membrane protein [Streptomyces sulfonofaciens]|uniref:Membrane protein n=1 Tax=Streptomyces sulfonofaciens TaxID=68272 RepID=A0A919GBM0_9ACTN|nr:zf-HC2 domain-containing protein [Streptomyces sulfonofaciens]GHH81454.1 membrane protein [Streptomyces sulfonofaciens]